MSDEQHGAGAAARIPGTGAPPALENVEFDDGSGEGPPPITSIEFDDGSGETPPPITPLRLFDAEPGRERVRAALALILVALLTVMVLMSLVAAVIDEEAGGRLKSLLDTLLPPVVALCGSAIGFYYAGRPNQ